MLQLQRDLAHRQMMRAEPAAHLRQQTLRRMLQRLGMFDAIR